MKRDRNAVRDVRRMISVNQYDLDRINRLLEASGAEEARIIYRCFKRGLDEIEQSIRIDRAKNNRRRAAESA